MRDFVAKHAPCGLVDLDPTGVITDVNDVFLRWTRRTRDEIVGLRLSDLIDEEAEGREPVANDQRSGPSGTRAVTVRLRASDDTSMPVLISWNREGDRIIAALFDATRREEFETQIVTAHSLVERQHRRLNLLLRSAVEFAEALDGSELASELAEVARDAYSATSAAVFLIDDSAHISLMAGALPFEQSVQGELLSEGAMQLREVITIEDVTVSPILPETTRDALGAAGTRGFLVAPISHEGRQLGLLTVFFDHVRVFDSEAVPLAEALTRQAGQVLARITLQEQLRLSAMLDDITGLPNRRLFEERMQRFAGLDDLVGVAFIDLDGFKPVNDTLGHDVGDAVLREVASRIQGVVRAEDAVARYGGDEFVAVLHIPDSEVALLVAERIREAIARPYDTTDLPITASVGLAVAAHGSDARVTAKLVRLADQAMYRAKREGGNRVQVASA